jgi:hypothetical protein
MTPTCVNCRFSRDTPDTRESVVACHRFPPQFHPLQAIQLIPHPAKDFWCGEWAVAGTYEVGFLDNGEVVVESKSRGRAAP